MRSMNNTASPPEKSDHERIIDLERRIAELERQIADQLPIPLPPSPMPPSPQPWPYKPENPWPNPWYDTSVRCPKCGMEWKGAMGYVCSDTKCPMQAHITCSITAETPSHLRGTTTSLTHTDSSSTCPIC